MGHSTRRLMMGAAGAGGDSTYIEDVFSTYLYKGNNQNGRPIDNGIKLNNDSVGNSVYFNGSGQIEIASTSDFAFGTGDYTVEFWINYSSVADYMSIFEGRPTNSNGEYFSIQINGGNLQVYINSVILIQVTSPATSQWHHIAVVREGTGTNQLKLYINGTQSGQATDTANYGNQRCLIAGHAWSRGSFYGNLSNYRVTKGQALYTSNFTPSTQALTTTSQGATASNVKLLCCQSSTSATAATKSPSGVSETGSVESQLFGPFTGTDGEGGMVWVKNRTQGGSGYEAFIADTVRGNARKLYPSGQNAQSIDTTGVRYFTNNGFIVNDSTRTNYNNHDFASWTFRKSPGFFDIVTYTGNNTAGRTIPHNLGSIPGCIMVRRLDAGDSWQVYHRGNIQGDQNAAHYFLNLDQATPKTNNSSRWNDTEPTASVFTVGADAGVNTSGGEYVAYLFGGGESTAATAPSVDFNGSSYLDIADHSDFTFGTDDFTIECWYKADDLNLSNSWDYIFSSGWPVQLGHTVTGSGSRFSFYFADSNSTSSYLVSNLHTGYGSVNAGQWYHVAVTRSGSTFRIFLNGELKNTATSSGSAPAPNINSAIGRFSPSSPYYYADGQISNFRYVKGTAVYTESFRPPTEPLTAIPNTKLLCCNSSSVTGSTVTPGTITNNSATASTDSPFDDLEGYKFGEEGDQNIIKCGSYIGNGSSSDGPTIECGFEPQWILQKGTGGNENWWIYDTMRGIVASYNDNYIIPDLTNAEGQSNVLEVTPTGFKITTNGAWANQNGYPYIYMAIRRPDGYVGKPAEAGTDVFAMDTNTGSDPRFISNFPVDFATLKLPDGAQGWYTGARLIQGKNLMIDETSAETTETSQQYDYQNGYYESLSGLYQAWMWKRHAGFDVVTYIGNSSGDTSGDSQVISHNLGKVPEMIWTKGRNGGSGYWGVYHKGLNGGTNPWNYRLLLNDTHAESDGSGSYTTWYWNDTAPTATHFNVGEISNSNANNINFVAMLFASVEGISKVGYYDGSNSPLTITTGFQPRFFFVKRYDAGGNWTVFDTLRGWGSGNDCKFEFNTTGPQNCNTDFGYPTSTGIYLTNDPDTNLSGRKFIYYAHA